MLINTIKTLVKKFKKYVTKVIGEYEKKNHKYHNVVSPIIKVMVSICILLITQFKTQGVQ